MTFFAFFVAQNYENGIILVMFILKIKSFEKTILLN